MNLWFYADLSGWGARLFEAALKRGHYAFLSRDAETSDAADCAFVRMHLDPATRAHDKTVVARLAEKQIKVVPSARAARLYDDKIAQAAEISRWLPQTFVAKSRAEARAAVLALGLPLMSKAAEGASSRNVRFIRTIDDADREIDLAFGPGIPSQYNARQKGYVLFQKFCAGNDYDFRVIAVGRERLILRRGNREDRPMASGANKEMAITWPDAEAAEVLDFADQFFSIEKFSFCGIDVVKDCGDWRVLECTTSWPTKNNDAHRTVSGRNWGDFFEIILDEIESGALGD